MSVPVLKKALKELRQRGWTQQEYSDYDGCVCAVGALNAAVTGEPEDTSGDGKQKAYLSAMTLVASAINKKQTVAALKQAEDSYRDRSFWQADATLFGFQQDALLDIIATWNDRKSRRKKDVEALFEKIIAERSKK